MMGRRASKRRGLTGKKDWLEVCTNTLYNPTIERVTQSSLTVLYCPYPHNLSLGVFMKRTIVVILFVLRGTASCICLCIQTQRLYHYSLTPEYLFSFVGVVCSVPASLQWQAHAWGWHSLLQITTSTTSYKLIRSSICYMNSIIHHVDVSRETSLMRVFV